MNTQPHPGAATDQDWWRGAVIYQVYPRSYQDSNGDGIGDLRGIIQRLPHIAALGADAVWISPFFTSPMKDFGYDVSDYRDVDPMFGSLADFDDLVAAATDVGLKIVIDLVLSHTSDQHAWFQESRQNHDNARANWYVWADPKPDGGPPTNWLSIFGGPAWKWDGRREQYYLHNFLESQPDLNFHDSQVQAALLDVARFWLGRGAGGFRLDTINFYFHDQQLRDNPPLAPHLRNSTIAPQVNPYNHQDHLYDKNRPENPAFLRKLRAVMDDYGAVAVGEVGDAQRGLEIMGEYTAGDDLMQMCYAFELLNNARPKAQDIAQVLRQVAEQAADGWPCWAYSNHDVRRQASRWGVGLEGQRLMTTLMMCLRGSVCLYQGEELGLPEADVAFEDLQDPYGIEFWPEFKGRDGCRTPMVWSSDAPNSGFSDAKPWLPVPPEHPPLSVAAQESDPKALLHHYRRATALRKAHPALAHGTCRDVQTNGDRLSFIRATVDETLFCAFNLSDESVSLIVPDAAKTWSSVGDSVGGAAPDKDGSITLGPWRACILHKT